MPNFNPDIHHRRSIRLKGYDYSSPGLYFITICCKDQINRFGNVEKKKMIFNDYGKIAYNEWLNLAERFPNFKLDVFQIMPDHIHTIINLSSSVRATLAVAPTVAPPLIPNPPSAALDPPSTLPKSHSIPDIVSAYKSIVAVRCLELYKSQNIQMGRFWHRNYYETIIRDDDTYKRISDYILANPAKYKGKMYGQP